MCILCIILQSKHLAPTLGSPRNLLVCTFIKRSYSQSNHWTEQSTTLFKGCHSGQCGGCGDRVLATLGWANSQNIPMMHCEKLAWGLARADLLTGWLIDWLIDMTDVHQSFAIPEQNPCKIYFPIHTCTVRIHAYKNAMVIKDVQISKWLRKKNKVPYSSKGNT